MKIAFLASPVTPLLPAQPGGAQAVLCDIAAGLTRRGHDVSQRQTRPLPLFPEGPVEVARLLQPYVSGADVSSLIADRRVQDATSAAVPEGSTAMRPHSTLPVDFAPSTRFTYRRSCPPSSQRQRGCRRLDSPPSPPAAAPTGLPPA